jgi:hypothetical protein
MNLADILNKLADLDYDIIRLEGERALAQRAADTAQVARLDEEIGRIYEAKEELRADFGSRHGAVHRGRKRPI